MLKLAEVASEQSSDKCKTFLLFDEGYTLGNALVTVMSLNPDVEFCACQINHNYEGNIYLRIEVKKGKAVEALKEGLQNLETICDYTMDAFNEAYERCKQSNTDTT